MVPATKHLVRDDVVSGITDHDLFAFDDQKEGMAAFIEKRAPVFRDA